MGDEIGVGEIGEDGAHAEGPEEGEGLESPEDDISDDELEEILNESIEETVARSQKEALEQGENKPSEGEQQPAGPQSKDTTDQKPLNNQPKQEAVEEAPNRFSLAAKEAWKTADPVLRKEYAKAIQDLENGQMQKLREIAGIRQEAEAVTNAIAPWSKEWAKDGMSASQGVVSLIQTHEKLIENAPAEIARLIKDNGTSIQEVQAVMEGRAPSGTGNGQGYNQDISQHPKFQALQNQFNELNNHISQQSAEATAKAETDKLKELRDFVDENGFKPYERILDPAFIDAAQPDVNALRTPARDAQGRFVAGSKIPSISEAYIKAYHIWTAKNGITPQRQATENQPSNSVQPQRKPSEPISYRPRKAPSGRGTSLQEGNPADFLNESVEETMKRVLATQ